MGKASRVVEMDGNYDSRQELDSIESALSNTKTKFMDTSLERSELVRILFEVL